MTIGQILMLLGGVGLFLFGMTQLSSGLRAACGDHLRTILEKATRNPVLAVLVGLAVTVLVQSSSATDVMVIGFVSSGMMTLGQAVGVIIGASVGTTITAQITAFSIGTYTPAILFAGAILVIFCKNRMARAVGTVLLGFGMLFQGITMMKEAIKPLAELASFRSLVDSLESPPLLILFGVLFTALLQSSSSSTVIFQAFAVQGLLRFEDAAWLCVGAAIGSVTPNLLASLTTGREGRRTALSSLVYNLLRAVLVSAMLLIFPVIFTWIENLSPDDVARQVANTHTIFALTAVIATLPLTNVIVKLAERTIPLKDYEQRSADEQKLIYLVDDNKRVVPAVAMKQAMLEVTRMGHMARENLETALNYFFDPTKEDLYVRVEEREKTIDYLDHAISDKLVTLRSLQLSDNDVFRLSRLVRVVSNFERIGDHAENVIEFGERLKNAKASISEAGTAELRAMSGAVLETLDVAMQVFENEQFDLLPKAEALEQRVDDMQEQFIQNHIDRLMVTACNPLCGVVFTDMCTDLERCSDQAINVATALYNPAKHGRMK